MADTVSLFDLHVQCPIDLENFSMDTGGAAQKCEIDRRRTDAKLRQRQTIEPTWEQRTDDPKTLAEPIRLKAQQGGQKKRQSAGRPSLRMAGDRIAHGDLIFLPAEAAEYFW